MLLWLVSKSISKQAFRHDYEIIVVDNHSSDASVEQIRLRFPEVVLIESPRNLGFAAGNNLGIQASQGGYILLLNSDTELPDNGIDDLIDLMTCNEGIALLTCKLINPDGSAQDFIRHFPSLRSAVQDTFFLTALFARVPTLRRLTLLDTDYETPRDVDQIAGAFMLLRASLLTEIGALDERFFMYYEDVDFCLRLKKRGLRVVFSPEVQVIHHAGTTFRLHRVAATSQRLTSKMLYFQKHHPHILFPIRLLVTIELSWRCLVALLIYPVMRTRYRFSPKDIGDSFQSGIRAIWNYQEV